MDNAQGTNEWRKERLSRITASRLGDVMGSAAAQASYARQLREEMKILRRIQAGEVVPEQPDFYAAATAWGKKWEPIARAEYEFRNDVTIELLPFQVHDVHPFVGASPDGMFLFEKTANSVPSINKPPARMFDFGRATEIYRAGIEIKCPYSQSIHATTLLHGVSDEHKPQVQGEIWVCDFDFVDFVSFDPRRQDENRYFQTRVWRDDKYIALMEKRVIAFWEFVLSNEDVPKTSPGDVPVIF